MSPHPLTLERPKKKKSSTRGSKLLNSNSYSFFVQYIGIENRILSQEENIAWREVRARSGAQLVLTCIPFSSPFSGHTQMSALGVGNRRPFSNKLEQKLIPTQRSTPGKSSVYASTLALLAHVCQERVAQAFSE